MEDISRELEREIARSKPKPYKQDRKTRILIIDDFGKMKSGEYLKTFVKILFFTSVVCFVSAVLFYYLYTGLSKDARLTKAKLILAEKQVDELTSKKEILMARLVISGKEPGIKKPIKKPIENKKADKPVVAEVEEKKPIPAEPVEEGDKTDKSSMTKQEKSLIEPKINEMDESVQLPELAPEIEPSKEIRKTISIEKFTVKKDRRNGDLLVRFDIRNISTESGDVSGRIFAVLKPGNESEDQWLVVPTSALKDGVPSEYKKGQYFSIAHFKPVKFRIKNQADPDFFKKASIFIFNEQAQLIFEELINITEAE
ncbi:MAG: hypothetical protein DRH93_05485 [Deltaproteobacteria bacterium]|nr:MAG: hypothetical protein DRH93_05485 [Deltaproteobacteria bacterium]